MYVIEIGVLDKDERLVPNFSARDFYSDITEAQDAFEKLTRNYVFDFLDQDLSFYENDIGFYKILEKDGDDFGTISEMRWYLSKE